MKTFLLLTVSSSGAALEYIKEELQIKQENIKKEIKQEDDERKKEEENRKDAMKYYPEYFESF